jgi:hypothetical protein
MLLIAPSYIYVKIVQFTALLHKSFFLKKIRNHGDIILYAKKCEIYFYAKKMISFGNYMSNYLDA